MIDEPKQVKQISDDEYKSILEKSYQIKEPIWKDCSFCVLDTRLEQGIIAVQIMANPFNSGLYTWDSDTPKEKNMVKGFPATKFYVKNLTLLSRGDKKDTLYKNIQIQHQTYEKLKSWAVANNIKNIDTAINLLFNKQKETSLFGEKLKKSVLCIKCRKNFTKNTDYTCKFCKIKQKSKK
jgi:hypothetical protein